MGGRDLVTDGGGAQKQEPLIAGSPPAAATGA